MTPWWQDASCKCVLRTQNNNYYYIILAGSVFWRFRRVQLMPWSPDWRPHAANNCTKNSFSCSFLCVYDSRTRILAETLPQEDNNIRNEYRKWRSSTFIICLVHFTSCFQVGVARPLDSKAYEAVVLLTTLIPTRRRLQSKTSNVTVETVQSVWSVH